MADRTESSTVIDAQPGAVLDVIADFDSYPEWAGEVKKVAVISEDGDGWADQVEFTLAAGAIKDTYVLEYDWDVAENGTGVISWTLVSAQVLKAMQGRRWQDDDGRGNRRPGRPSGHQDPGHVDRRSPLARRHLGCRPGDRT